MIGKFLGNIFKWAKTSFFTHSWIVSSIFIKHWYFYLILHMHFHTVTWFQILLFIVYTQLYGVAETTSYLFLACKLIWSLWSLLIFTQWGWLILFYPDHNGESPPNSLFLRIFRAGWTYFLSSLFMVAEPSHHEESHLIYGPLSLPSLTKGSQ